MKKLLSLVLALVMMLGVVGSFAEDVAYERAEDEDIYMEVLGDYDEMMKAAKAAKKFRIRFKKCFMEGFVLSFRNIRCYCITKNLFRTDQSAAPKRYRPFSTTSDFPPSTISA